MIGNCRFFNFLLKNWSFAFLFVFTLGHFQSILLQIKYRFQTFYQCQNRLHVWKCLFLLRNCSTLGRLRLRSARLKIGTFSQAKTKPRYEFLSAYRIANCDKMRYYFTIERKKKCERYFHLLNPGVIISRKYWLYIFK